jgi:ubiquinone/menaquinone biosynthesis C-methylase UbiE
MELELTGERYLPSCMKGQIKYEHLHRYALSIEFARDKQVLDIASGEGYGSANLSKFARSVVGVDIDSKSVEYANQKYGDHPNLEFVLGACEAIPLPSQSVDLVTSFETIEHHDKHEEMMQEIKRVLKHEGLLIISSPNRLTYSDLPGYSNPFHVKELYDYQFISLLNRHFKHVQIYGQRLATGSFVFPVKQSSQPSLNSYTIDNSELTPKVCSLDAPIYFIALCSDELISVPQSINSIYIDKSDDLFKENQVGLEESQFKLHQTKALLSQYQSQLHQTEIVLVQYQSQLDRTEAVLEQSQSQLHQTEAVLEQSQSQLHLTRQQWEQSQLQLHYTQTELKQSQLQLHYTQTELKQSQSQLYQAQAGLKQSQSQLHQTETVLEQSQLQLHQTETVLEQSQSQLHQTETVLEQSQSQLHQTQTELKQFESQLAQNEAKLTQTHRELEQSQSQLHQTEAELEQLNFQLAEAQAELAQTCSQLHQTQAVLEQSYSQLHQTQAVLEQSYSQLHQTQAVLDRGGFQQALATHNDLPDRQSDVQYRLLLWDAWYAYGKGDMTAMAQCLQQSLKCTPLSRTETVVNWLESFAKLSSEKGCEFDTYSLTNSAEWKQLMRSITALRAVVAS